MVESFMFAHYVQGDFVVATKYNVFVFIIIIFDRKGNDKSGKWNEMEFPLS